MRGGGPVCPLCQKDLREGEERLRLRGATFVHRRCATYRLRNRRGSSSRLGYPA